jgi:RNA polymerase sigma-70 factor (ECF subfamily)
MTQPRGELPGSDPQEPSSIPSGLDVLTLTWMPVLRRYSLSLVGDPHDAEDIVQETFLEAQRSIGRFESGGDFGAWLRGIARNVAARRRRELSRRARVTVSLEPRVLERIDRLYREEEIADEGPLEVLRRCLEKLSPYDRNLLWARYEGGMRVDALAARAGRTVSWAKTRLMRARWWLQDCVLRGLKRPADAGGTSA